MHIKIISKSTIKIVALLLLFRLSLDLAYIYVVSPVYSYSGFTTSLNVIAVIESYFLTILIGMAITPNIDRASHFFIWMFAIASIIPTLSYYALHSGSRIFMYSIMIGFFCVVLVSKLPVIRIGTLKEGRSIGIFLLIIMVTAVAASLIAKGGLSHFNLDLSKVYEHRGEVGLLINAGIWGYINTWVYKVVNPALIAWALWRKRYRLFLIFTALQVLFFAISSHKSVLFYPVLILAVYFFVRKKEAFKYITWGLIGVIIFSSCIYLIFDNIWLASLFVRRVFFVPAQLNFAYYELFSDIGHVYLSNSIFSSFVNYPFEYNYTNMVSLYLLGHPNANCNNGFLATGYMHFGYLGMWIFSIIIGLLLWIADSLVGKRMPKWLGISIITIPFFSLFTSADLGTSLLTHGILMGFLILLIIGKNPDLLLNNSKAGGLHESYLPHNLSS